MTKQKRRFGDRYDGRRLRSLDPFYRIIPFIMRYRSDSQNFFEDKIEISHTEAFYESEETYKRQTIGMLHFWCCHGQDIALRPALNRFNRRTENFMCE